MLDKKKDNRKLITLSHQVVETDGLSLEQLEREIIAKLIEYSHEDTSTRLFSSHTLYLLKLHPVLKNKIAVIWKYDTNLGNLTVIASANLRSDIQSELLGAVNDLEHAPYLSIHYQRLNNRFDSFMTRMDIHLDKIQGCVYFASFWNEATAFEYEAVVPFLKDAFGVYTLSIIKINAKHQDKLLTTILEKAGDSVEITDEEAVIQYVNPAFEKITLYTAAEAINKTVSSLLRSPKQDTRLFDEIKQRLDSGNSWRGEIQSRKKDGSYWIAQATIVPVIDEELGKITQHIAIKQDITEHVAQINQLRLSEERYRNLMNAATDAIYIHTLDGRMLEANTAACNSLGYTREEMAKLHVRDVEIGVTDDMLKRSWNDLQKKPISLEGRHVRKDGSTFPVDVRLALFNATGEKLVLAIVRDMSVQKQSEDTIRKLTRAVEQSPVLVMITDKEGFIEYLNAKGIDLLGYTLKEILGKSSRMLQSGKTSPELYKHMWEQLSSGNEWRGELLNKNKKGEYFWVSAIISPLRDNEETTHYLAVMEDISQKKSYEEMLKHQATYDNLTNLPNRFYGYNKLEHAIAKAHAGNKQLALLFIDLDEFKQINDSLGHAAGDLLLKAVSERYLSVLRKSDTIARLGGDEFMIILENLHDSSHVETIVKKCHDVCLLPFQIESHEMLVFSSIGIAIYPEHGKDAKTLMRNADTAMYQSKVRGKNNWTIFANTMAEVASNRMRIKTELQQILSRDELYMCYQPIIDLKTNKVIAGEALLRWQSAALGPIMPDQIIPIAEETGLIIPLGYWILKKVCQQAKEWQSQSGRPIKVAVNISTLQLKQQDFVLRVKEILAETQLAAEYLIFEITESVFIDDSKFILSQLNELTAMGIHCSLDDFGMGYSSLSYIRSYPFKSLKIDRVFIQGINSNSDDLSLVNSIITMSRNLKLAVIAEGVETAEQLALMKSMNCDMVQGWYFAQALTNDKFLIYLESN